MRHRRTLEINALLALWIRKATLTNPKKILRINDFLPDERKSDGGFKSVSDMTEPEIADLKKRLSDTKDFFDAHPHPDLIGVQS
jgi:hypothetical protein